MSNGIRKAARITIIGLMAGIAPVASAIGQDMSNAQPNASQQLIQQAANQQPVGQPASMVAAQPAPAQVAPAPAAEPSVTSAAIDEAQRRAETAAAETREIAALNARAEALRAGQFVWQPERSPTGNVEVVVSLSEQKAYVYRANKLIAVSTVSTGRAGHRTPTGTFPIIEKHRTHFSNLYNNAPMPNMQRLTMGGIALHAGQLPGYAASHGCVRLPMEFSRLLFGITSRGNRVHIIQGSPPSANDALAFATGRPIGGMQMASAR